MTTLRYLHVSKKEIAMVESSLEKLKRSTNNKNFNNTFSQIVFTYYCLLFLKMYIFNELEH